MVDFDPQMVDDTRSALSSRLSYVPKPMGENGKALNFIVYDKE